MARTETEQLVFSVEARIAAMEKQMARASRVTDKTMTDIERRGKTMTGRLEQSMAASASRVTGLMKSFGVGFVGGLTAALAPMAIFQRALHDIDQAAGLVRLADRIGISTTSLQVLQQQAHLVGVEFDTMGDGLGDFASKIAEAAAGAGPLKDIFKANGVELRNQNGTLRSIRDLLGEFADLVKFAGSDAERLFLMQQAFGDEAAKMLPIFKDGAAGLEKMEVNAKAAGSTINEELLKRAAELDKRFDSMWQTFDVKAKNAILSAIEGMDSLLDRMNRFEQNRRAVEMGTLAGSLVGRPGDVYTPGKAAKPTALDARIAGAFTGEMVKADEKLVDALRKRYGDAAHKATIIPSPPASKGGGGVKPIKKTADDAFSENIKAVEDMIAALKVEQSTLGMSFEAREQATTALRLEQQALKDVQEAARKKGDADWRNVQLSQTQKDAIMGVAAAYAHEAEMLRQAQEMQDLERNVLKGAFGDLRSALDDGKLDWQDFANIAMNALDKIVDKIENDLVDAILQASSAGGGGNIWSTLFGGIGGSGTSTGIPWAEDLFRASGGPVKAGQPYIVGEKRPELFVPGQSGTILPSVPKLAAVGNVSSAGAQQITIHVDVTGANGNQEIMAMVYEGVSRGIGKFASGPGFTGATAKALKNMKVKGIRP